MSAGDSRPRSRIAAIRHVFLAADGHVKLLRPEQVPSGPNGVAGDAQVADQYTATATNAMHVDAAHTRPTSLTFSIN